MEFSSATIRRFEQVLGKDAAAEIHERFAAVGGSVVHTEGEEDIKGRKIFFDSIDINGVPYEWPISEGCGVLTNDGDGNLSWTVLAGVGTVTSVGLRMPPEYIVSESPVSFSGDFVVDKAPQAANSIYAGPLSGGKAQPSFRKLVVSDIPTLPVGKIDLLKEELEALATVSSLEEMRRVLDSLISDYQRKSDRSEVMEGLSSKVSVKEFDHVKEGLFRAIGRKSDAVELESGLERVEATGRKIKDEVCEHLDTKAPVDSPSFVGTVMTSDISVADGSSISLGQNKGVRVGKSRHEKLAFYGAIPVPQPSGNIITALANLGLVREPSIWMDDIVGLKARLDAIEERLGGSDV